MSDPAKTRMKPTLDDLMAVKRVERPDESFWNEFERGLRQKQLAAIVLPRPWWHAPSLWARKAAPYGVFAAAAAALALAFTTLRAPVPIAGRSTLLSSAASASVVMAPVVNAVTITQEVSAPGLAVSASAPVEVASAALAGPASQDIATELAAADAVTVSTPVASVMNLSTPDVTLARAATAPGIADPLFVAEPVVAEALALTPSSSLAEAPLPETSVDRLVIEPPAVLHTRHDRLLAKALEDAPGADDRSLAQVRERVVHRLADGEELYASITRVGVSGDRLSLKF
jgi:hypothetical protein